MQNSVYDRAENGSLLLQHNPSTDAPCSPPAAQGEGQSEEMFGYALRHPRCPARNGELNGVGLTPLTLACRLARSEIFREMLELTCVEFWRYSNITCSAYPLNALDTIGPRRQDQ